MTEVASTYTPDLGLLALGFCTEDVRRFQLRLRFSMAWEGLLDVVDFREIFGRHNSAWIELRCTGVGR